MLVPANFLGIFGYLAWHGGLCWNMRYLNPALPFLAILTSHEVLRLVGHVPIRRLTFRVGVALLWMLLAMAFASTLFKPNQQETLLLNGSLAIAGSLLAVQAAEVLVASRRIAFDLGKVLGWLLAFCLIWSSALTVYVEYPIESAVRHYMLTAARRIQPNILPCAVIMTYWPDPVWGLLETDRKPIIADYTLAPPQQAVELVERAISHHPIYWIMPGFASNLTSRAAFNALKSRNIRIDLTASGQGYRLFRLRTVAASHEEAPQSGRACGRQ